MTLNGVMPIILRNFAEFSSFRGQLRKVVDWPSRDFLLRNVIKYTNETRRAHCALCGSGASCLFRNFFSVSHTRSEAREAVGRTQTPAPTVTEWGGAMPSTLIGLML